MVGKKVGREYASGHRQGRVRNHERTPCLCESVRTVLVEQSVLDSGHHATGGIAREKWLWIERVIRSYEETDPEDAGDCPRDDRDGDKVFPHRSRSRFAFSSLVTAFWKVNQSAVVFTLFARSSRRW